MVEEYRGVTLLDAAYKVYVGVIERKLGREMEEKRMYRITRRDSGKGWGR